MKCGFSTFKENAKHKQIKANQSTFHNCYIYKTRNNRKEILVIMSPTANGNTPYHLPPLCQILHFYTSLKHRKTILRLSSVFRGCRDVALELCWLKRYSSQD